MSYPDDGGRIERLSREHLGIVTTLRTEIHEIRSAVKEECRDLIVDGQKPLSLMRALVSDFTDPGELVCDPYSGGGTTAVACQELGRRFLGWEQERETYDKASARIKEAGKQQPLPLARAKATQLQLGG